MDREVDDEGRYICLYCKIYHRCFVLVALYIPPPYSCSVFKKVLPFLTKYPNVPGIIVGDYNTTVNHYWDRVQTDTEPRDRALTPFG